MSIQAVGWALDQDLPARPKLVLVSIANHANSTDGYCWLKAETIAAEAACTPRSVFRFIGGLIRNGFLRRSPKRGADGKQRANDYWLLLNREPATWDWGAGLHDETDENEPESEEITNAETHTGEDGDPLDIDGSEAASIHAVSHGPHDSPVIRQDDSAHAVSHGPCDSRVSHKGIAEPSKTNPEDARARARPPRGYKPPPPEPPPPVGAVVGRNAELIFVFKPSKAYEAWAAVKERETGRRFAAEAWKDGRCGWYFPSLFPPDTPPRNEGNSGEIDPPFSKTG